MFASLRRSMVARILAIGAVALVTSGSQVGCNGGEGSVRIEDPPLPPPANVGTSFTTALVLRDAGGIERYTFRPGESITFELTVSNRTSQDAEVSFTGFTGTVDVFTPGGNESLWNPYNDRLFAQVIRTQNFGAGETQVFRFVWNQVLPTDSNLGLGIYEARGEFLAGVRLGGPNGPAVDDRELMSTPRNFTIN